MSLNYVTLTLDLYDGQGNPVISGEALFTPTAQLTDTTNHELITQAAVPAVFHSAGTPTVKLLATDNGPPAPAGWAWTATFSGVAGNPASFSFFLPYASGSAQNLSAQAPVSAPSSLLGSTAAGVSVYPSGDTTGATDQANITAAEALSRTVYFAPGTFWVTGLTKQGGTAWQGAGRGITIIKLANSSNKDVVQGANFSTLTLSGQVTLPNAGIGTWAIRDLTIDGNQSHQSGTSYGLRFYGYDFRIEHVTIQNALTGGMYSEWGGFGGTGLADFDDSAGYFHDMAIWGNGGHGWHNRGPHDSVASKVYIYDNGSGSSYGYWGEANNPTTVAAGSNGVSVSTFAGAGTLNVATTLGWNTASISSSQGAVSVVTSGGTSPAVITYTGVTATSFTGCTTVSGSGTLATGAAVSPTGVYSAAGHLMAQCHTWYNQLYGYVLDCQTHLIDCVAEVVNDGGAMVVARGNDCQIEGGFLVIYQQFSPTGLGLQIGDAANAASGLRADTKIVGMTGADSAHAAISIVNDAGGCSIDAVVYQPSGTAVFGTPNTSSRYRVISAGATVAANTANSLFQEFGLSRIYVPPSSGNAWRLTPGGGTSDAVNYNSTSNRFDLNNGILLQGWSGAYTGSTFQVDTSKGHMIWPSTTAPAGVIVTSAIGTAGNGAATTITGNDRRGKITITTASSGIGSFPATVLNVTFASAYGSTPRVILTPWDGPSAAVLPYSQAFSITQFLIGFNSAPAISTTYSYTYVVEG
jgi:hypothetical protein